MQLLVSLGAALPVEQPRLSWAASLGCGHFLGLLFRLLARDQTQEVTSLQPPGDGGENLVDNNEDPPPTSQPPRARSCQTKRRMRDKRRKHLGLCTHSTSDSRPPAHRPHVSPEPRPAPRGHVLAEAAATLDTVCADYIASMHYKEVDTHILWIFQQV